jgi:sterol desaturase/sphingolipid hydroxylase (fatty acid hydroxylase superfamily)
METSETVRLIAFVSVLLICSILEFLFPRKVLTQNKVYRWFNNLGLIAFNSITLTIMMPIVAFEAASLAADFNFGLLHWTSLSWPLWLEMCFGILALDLAIYTQHVIFHRIPLLWRLHRMHHADQDIDVTTGIRFHPIEILLSMWIKIVVVMLLGVSPLIVIIFEILLNASALFNHSNIYLPKTIDRYLRFLIVTPDMHRVHHSIIPKETHSNFGFFLSIWDRIFNTYLCQPSLGHQHVSIGLPIFRSKIEQRIDKMLSQPFRNK